MYKIRIDAFDIVKAYVAIVLALLVTYIGLQMLVEYHKSTDYSRQEFWVACITTESDLSFEQRRSSCRDLVLSVYPWEDNNVDHQ